MGLLRRRLIFTIAAAGVFLLVLGGWLLMSIGGKPPVLPNPNGYDDFLQAGQSIIGSLDGVSELNHDQLRALVATNANALRLARVGLERTCSVPTEAHLANFANVSRDLATLKSVATLLAAEGRLAEMENRPADAARSYVDAIRLGNETSRGGMMIHRLVGIACEGIGNTRLVKLLPHLPCEQLRPLAAELQRIDETSVPWREVLQNERRFARAQAGNFPNPMRLIQAWWQTRASVNQSAERHSLAAAHLRLLFVEMALRARRCDDGRGPETLAQLAPQDLKTLPLDPFSDSSLIYRPTGTNWMLYSLGPNRADDGGKPAAKLSSSTAVPPQGDLFYDSPW